MRLLIARAGALGDLLLLRRAIHAVRRAGHALSLLAPPPGAVLAGTGPAEVGRHLPWDARDAATLMSGARVPDGPFREALEACDFALAYTRSVDLVHGLARLVPVTFGFDPTPPDAAERAAVWLTRPVRAMGLDVSAAPPPLGSTSEAQVAAAAWHERLPRGFLAIHPGSGSTAKNWPCERFLELADALAPGQAWLLALGPAETHLLARTPREPRAARALAHAVALSNAPLGVLAAVLRHAGLYVGNDSGATHLAAACGVPTLALFGPTDPRVWAPEGDHVTALRAPEGRLTSLALDTVLRAALALRSAEGARTGAARPTA